MPQQKISVLHMIDSLAIGGAEKMTVNIVNSLSPDRYDVHLCSSRRDGPLLDEVTGHVKHLSLGRKWRFDTNAIRALVRYLKIHHIEVIHAHSSSILLATVVKQFLPNMKVIWHMHYGIRPEKLNLIYRVAVAKSDWIIGVNTELVDWIRWELPKYKRPISYIPNFSLDSTTNTNEIKLPGNELNRITCVANMRPQKDHFTLIRALSYVIKEFPAHVLLVGAFVDTEYVNRLKAEISNLELEEYIHFLGPRQDIPNILKASTIGVMPSLSEGFPVAIIEYGMYDLPTVATRVGQCETLLMNGDAGILVPSSSPKKLANGILKLLMNPDLRESMAKKFHQHVNLNYSADAVINQLCQIYDELVPQ